MKRCHENEFEIGDRVKYNGLQLDYINKKGTIAGWFDKDSEMIAVLFDGGTWNSGIFPVNLRKIEKEI